ncbi:MAG: hypothetical protein JWM25_203 [Thermoleophilia bacterium]|nr:hypothetical protein [Thermoleophilia bacterium]MCZ4495620.1 hypothetical protein [Thermoleophilia bacterium]
MQLAPLATAAVTPPQKDAFTMATGLMGVAQDIAGKGSDNPAAVSANVLLRGANAAGRAADLLAIATPRTPFHHLTEAAQQMREAASLLVDAASARDSMFSQPVIDATVERLSRDAFDTIERAWEIVEND